MFKFFASRKGGLVLVAAIAAGAYFVIWHQAHVASALPFTVLLVCPLMDLFKHGGHGHQY